MDEWPLSAEEEARLLAEAWAYRDRAHAPYSKFLVGAALLVESGEVVGGCNVECASYGAGVCAERTAVVAAVSLGFRRFRAIAIVTKAPAATPPCGICRQFLAEFAPALPVLFTNGEETVRSTLRELLPHQFDASQLR